MRETTTVAGEAVAVAGETRDPGARQYLGFVINGEEYAVDILRVQCIQGWTPATPLPDTPDFVLGIINLRGTVVPVIDLRMRFGFEDVRYDKLTVVLIVKADVGARERTVGLVVDAMSEVYAVTDERIQPAPELGTTIGGDFIQGVTTVADHMVILVDVDRLVGRAALDLEPQRPSVAGAGGTE